MNTLLNEAKGLQPLTLKHAKAVIELTQLDKPQFEGKVKLDLSNFHKMIDYGLLLNKGALDLESPDSWLDQLHKRPRRIRSRKNRACTSRPDRSIKPGKANIYVRFAGDLTGLVTQHILITYMCE